MTDQERLALAIEVLKELEWSGGDGYSPECPVCGRYKPVYVAGKHDYNCKLDHCLRPSTESFPEPSVAEPTPAMAPASPPEIQGEPAH